MKQRNFENKVTYAAFIDVHRAYDEAWRDMIFYTLWKNGIRDKIWRVI